MIEINIKQQHEFDVMQTTLTGIQVIVAPIFQLLFNSINRNCNNYKRRVEEHLVIYAPSN